MDNTWFRKFVLESVDTDKLYTQGTDHKVLLALGLMGEAGSIVSEVKKGRREGAAYPSLIPKLKEEIGDFLWYYVRLASVVDIDLQEDRFKTQLWVPSEDREDRLGVYLELSKCVGELLGKLKEDRLGVNRSFRDVFEEIWQVLNRVCVSENVRLDEIAEANTLKRIDRWGKESEDIVLFDEAYPKEEQLPREFEVEFIEKVRNNEGVVILRSNNINIGDSITDNIGELDDYRYHDVFHLGYMSHFGWSPVFRSLLRCKRKSNPSVDENEDGGRARVIEESISAIVFSRAKAVSYYEGIDHIDFDVLKNIKELVRGYEVEDIPLWLWEKAILESYAVFRRLKANKGGIVTADLGRRRLTYSVNRQV
ncbi:MAG: pyrophosphatase [Thermoplasmata archaeon]|nr:pyrophosphatase [Candidatus Sysuiplasma acidicola]